MEHLPLELIYKIADYLDDTTDDIESFFIALSNQHTRNLRSRVVEYHDTLVSCVFCGEHSRSVCKTCSYLESLPNKNKMTQAQRKVVLANYKLDVKFRNDYRRSYSTTQRATAYNKHEWIDFEFAYGALKKLNTKKKHCCLKNLMRASRLPRHWIMSNNTCKIKKIHMQKYFWFKFNVLEVIKNVKKNL